MVATIAQLFDAIDQHFLAPRQLDYALTFARSQRQVEGWFKGELLYLFRDLERSGNLPNWQSEASLPTLGKKRADFKVSLNDVPVYLELKAIYHGPQAKTVVPLSIYFYKDTNGIWPDVTKLASLMTGLGFCILFVYPSPPEKLWRSVLDDYAERIHPVAIDEVSDIRDYPPVLYIAKLQVLSHRERLVSIRAGAME